MPVIKLFANLRKLAGMNETQIEADNLRAAIAGLIKISPALENKLLEDGQIRAHYIITINGQLTGDLDARLTPDDMIAIFPPIAGG
jgi:molybdopterin synthase sulfur carrier subunit